MSDNPDWPRLFPCNTDAWKDFCEQAERRPNVRSGVAIGLRCYRAATHPRDCNEIWYVEPGRREKPAKSFRDSCGESVESAGPRKTLDEWLAQEGLSVDRSHGLLRGIVEAWKAKAKK